MNRYLVSSLVLNLLCWLSPFTSTPVFAQVLHVFQGNGQGSIPVGTLLLSGSTLYGMTAGGPTVNGFGTIFQVDTNGSGFAQPHAFAGGPDDGATPLGSLIQSGSTLYGMTSRGGSANQGTIFHIETDGSGLALMHSFQGGPSDGANPNGDLIQSGSTLYGMTLNGGDHGFGSIFKISTDGTGYSVLHSFAGGAADGSAPYGALMQTGSTLYGMTNTGGANDLGTIFQIGNDGTGFSLIHTFTGGPTDGANPYGALIQAGSTLFGETSAGGSKNFGTLFRVDTTGANFGLLHSYLGGNDYYSDGWHPRGTLIRSGSTLFAMSSISISQVDTDGSNYEYVADLGDPTIDDIPRSPILSDGAFYLVYGRLGRLDHQNGGVYRVVLDAPTTPEPSSEVLAVLAPLGMFLRPSRSSV